jgi:hypothetical protein
MNELKNELKTWQEELADCRAAAEAHPEVEIFLFVHHNIFCERLIQPLETRIRVILATKPEAQWACRFRHLRPLTFRLPAAYDQAWEAYGKAQEDYGKAGEAYDLARAACDQAREAWKARDQARAACDKAREAWKARDQARAACGKAQEDCKSELKLLLDSAWPGNTWTGKNIGWE